MGPEAGTTQGLFVRKRTPTYEYRTGHRDLQEASREWTCPRGLWEPASPQHALGPLGLYLGQHGLTLVVDPGALSALHFLIFFNIFTYF